MNTMNAKELARESTTEFQDFMYTLTDIRQSLELSVDDISASTGLEVDEIERMEDNVLAADVKGLLKYCVAVGISPLIFAEQVEVEHGN